MNDVVERVARAIYETRGFGLPNERDWENAHATLQITYKMRARAAIDAMRELSPEMVDAFLAWVPIGALPRTGWSAVIDAALADASPDIGKEGIGNE